MPIRFASEAWPRPGLAEPRSASIAGFGSTGPLSSTEQKGKDCHDQDKPVQGASFGFVFGTWNWYDFWRRSWGLPCSRPLLPIRCWFDAFLHWNSAAEEGAWRIYVLLAGWKTNNVVHVETLLWERLGRWIGKRQGQSLSAMWRLPSLVRHPFLFCSPSFTLSFASVVGSNETLLWFSHSSLRWRGCGSNSPLRPLFRALQTAEVRCIEHQPKNRGLTRPLPLNCVFSPHKQ